MTISLELLKLETNDKIFQRGEEFYNENPNNSLNFIQNNLTIQISADIKEYATKIKYNLESGQLIEKKCSCTYFEKNNKICKHIISLAHQTNLKLNKTIPNFELLDTYEKSSEIMTNIISLNSSPKTTNNEIDNAKTVTQITKTIKSLLEENPTLNNLYIKGEISNLTPNKFGHIYFSVKDEYSLLNCAMFKSSADSLTFQPKVGDKVLLKGNITVYEPRGSYSLVVKQMQKQGQGDLFQQFLQLKNKLEQKGLFNQTNKKPIPKYPKKIGVITSETGAVIQDIINTIKRRFPKIKIVLHPAKVQGEGSEKTLIQGLKTLDKQNCDTIIIGRGGGSIEDLWCFNNEELANEIFNTKTPIISAVGHQTDFTICDFVADLRAETPTAAAEIATPNLFDLNQQIENSKRRIIKSLEHNLENKKIHLMNLESNLENNFTNNIQTQKLKLTNLKEKLKLLSIQTTLKRGFSLTLDKDGKTVKDTQKLNKGEKLHTILESGKITSTIDKINNK